MIQEGIAKIEQLVRYAVKPEIIQIKGEPEHLSYYSRPDGTLTRLEAQPPLRHIQLFQINDLIALGKNHFDQEVRANDRMVCFYGDKKVTLIWDHKNGREMATVSLNQTQEYRFFEERARNPMLEVKDLRHALRVILRKTYKEASLIDQVSSLTFRNSALTATDMQRGKESFDRAILDAVVDPQKLPDPYQTFNVRMYTNPDLDVRFQLICLLDPDVSTRRWYLQPLEDSWIDFTKNVAELIGGKLRKSFEGTNVSVYEGSWSGLS